MSYNPKIKNLSELIQDLQMLCDGKIELMEIKEKMDSLDYKHDSSDGFEDILDSIRPFIKSLSKISEIEKDTHVKDKINELIENLSKEKSLEELEKIKN